MENSPFKFLDAYEREEKDSFFGREKETAILYQMTFDTRILLVYGASGTSKTSLIQAGLANKFSPSRWKDLFIRRNNDINRSLQTILNEELDKLEAKALDEELKPMQALEKLHDYTLLPLYLIFDQFEELFVLSKDEQEQNDFISFIEGVLSSTLPCKIILVMREEYLANLWPFEQQVPSLFDYRFRVEPMRKTGVVEVIQSTLIKLEQDKKIQVKGEHLPEIAECVFTKLTGGNQKEAIELTYLQVYLDQIYQKARIETDTDPPELSLRLIQSMSTIDDVIGHFLDEQIKQLENPKNNYKIRKGTPIRILGMLTTEEETKILLSYEQIWENLQDYNFKAADKIELHTCLEAFAQRRILKFFDEEKPLELSHDIIAKKVWERLPDVDKQLQQVKKSLIQRQQSYKAKKGSLLKNELIGWKDAIEILYDSLDKDVQAYITESKKQDKRERWTENISKWGIRVFVAYIVLMVLLIIGAGLHERFFLTKVNPPVLSSEQISSKLLDLQRSFDFTNDNSTVLLSILNSLYNSLPDSIQKSRAYYPDPLYDDGHKDLSSRFIARDFVSYYTHRSFNEKFIETKDSLIILKNEKEASIRADLIRPGAIMFYGKSNTQYENPSIDTLIAPNSPIGITYADIVVEVKKENGRILEYTLFSDVNNSINPHHRDSFPSFGFGDRPWVAIAFPYGREK